jgi:hypothetical protein
MQRCAHRSRVPLDDGEHRVGLRRDHRWHAGLEDRGLLGGDRLQRGAKKFQVVHRDRHNHAGERLVDHVGGIEPAAETDFQQQHVGRVAREQQERRGGLDLEHRDRRIAVGALAFRQRIGQGLVGD